MFGSTALDVVIGLVFVFLLYSLLASILQEIFSTWMGLRARILKKAVVRMLNDGADDHVIPKNKWYSFILGILFLQRFVSFWRVLVQRDPNKGTFARKFYRHPLIKYLGENTYNSKPAYLSAQNFSKVLVDLMSGMENRPGSNDAVLKVDGFLDGHIKPIENPESIIQTPDENRNDAEITDTSKASDSTRKTSMVPKVNLQLAKPVISTASNGNSLPAEDNEPAPVQGETYLFLQSLWADAQGDMNRFKALLEKWYDDTMERATGWYKQYTQFFLFFIGLGIAVAFNVDSITIAQKLAKDPKLREQVVQMADNFVKDHPNLDQELKKAQAARDAVPKDSVEKLIQQGKDLRNQADSLIKNDINNLNQVLGLGYSANTDFRQKLRNTFCTKEGWLRTLGWILTALAISLGAPFWFDLLNKLMQLRGAVKKSDGGKNDAGSSHPAENPIIRKG